MITVYIIAICGIFILLPWFQKMFEGYIGYHLSYVLVFIFMSIIVMRIQKFIEERENRLLRLEFAVRDLKNANGSLEKRIQALHNKIEELK